MSEIRSVAPTLCPSMLHVCILGVCACVQVSHRHTCADDQKQKDINTLAHSVFILEAQLCRPSPLSYQWMSLRLHHLLSPHLWHVAPRRRPILNTAVYVCMCFPCCRQFLIGATLDQLLCGVLVRRLIFDADCGFDKLAAGDGVRMCLHNTQGKKTAAFVSIINPSPLKKSCFLHLTLVSSHWCFWYWSASHFLESPSNIGLSQWNHQWNGWPAVLENICFLIANNKSQDCAVKNWWHLVI